MRWILMLAIALVSARVFGAAGEEPCVALRPRTEPTSVGEAAEPDLLAAFRQGPMAGVNEIIFAVRPLGEDPHWYANFGSTLEQSGWRTYLEGGRLCRLDLNTREVAVLLDEPSGGVRDPQVDYSGETILFSRRQGSSPYFHLYEMHHDGSAIRQLTDGPYHDVEPTYLPDGDIMFVSTRCNRRVNCHTTEVAVLYRCDRNGKNLRILSSNNEHDNTPWVLPNGQVLYTRWEYVDRNQMAFHHLWTTSPHGERQTILFGNLHPNITMIDAKPVPGSRKIVASFSPGHGLREHDGVVTLVDPRTGPDDQGAAVAISSTADYRDPWAFSPQAFMAARGGEIVLLNDAGLTQTIYRLPPADLAAGWQCHEPRPRSARLREPVVAASSHRRVETGELVLTDVYRGRNMAGVARGSIKKLLVLETLPKPMNYTGGMEPLSYGGTFTLERVLGTIPVESDGSAYAVVPALRSLFFVALDAQDLSVKRMQSFMTVMPGETVTCVGCHEQRTETPSHLPSQLEALLRAPSRIEPISDLPDVFDFPRDIQPILDRHCVACHDVDRRDGNVILAGDRGPIFSLSYYALVARNLISDGRNGLGNRPPRSIGSSASRLVELMNGGHYGAAPSERERRMVRLWIESGAPYPGTYAALGTGMIGGFEIVDRSIRLDRSDLEWPSVKAAVEAVQRRCQACHDEQKPLPSSPSHLVGSGGWGSAFEGAPPWVDLTPDDVRRRWSRDLLYNLSYPDKSVLLRAPLARASGGFESCGTVVFADTADPDYQKILAAIEDAKAKLEQIRRFDMPGFRPRADYVREMKRYGILPANQSEEAPLDVYATDRAYWQSLWYRPESVE
ncbi:MAG: HzsA-related protein [Pirellulaceae bacterium]